MFDEVNVFYLLVDLLQDRPRLDFHALQVRLQHVKILARQTCENSISNKSAIIAADV